MDIFLNKKASVLYIILLIFVFTLNLTACDQINTTTEVDEEQLNYNIKAYLPLNSGMKYSYKGEGNEFASIKRKNMFIEDNYLQFTEDNGGTVVVKIYKVNEQQISEVYKQGEFYEEKNLIPKIKEKENINQVILKAPLKIGNSWNTNNQKREIVGLDRKVKVPAGIFYHVIKIKINYKDSENIGYEYYAPNIGLIKTEYKGEDFVIKSLLESLSID
jgi:hypothetical protein